MRQTKPRSGSIAATLVLGLALVPSVAWAQEAEIEISGFEATDSALDEAALAAILNGDPDADLDGLAALDALTITIDRLEAVAPDGTVTVLSELVLANVVDGVAGTAAIDSITVIEGEELIGEFGLVTISDLDIGAILALSGQTAPLETDAFVPVFSSFSFSGGHHETDEAKCAFNATHLGSLSIHPQELAAMEALAEAGDDAEGEAFLTFMSSFQLDGLEFGGFRCKGPNADGRPIDFQIGGVTAGNFTPGLWPEIELADLSVTGFQDGEPALVSIASARWGATDYSHLLQLEDLDLESASFEAARRTMPHISGFSISGVEMDVADGSSGERIALSLGEMSVDVGEWFNGLPTSISFSIQDQVMNFQLDHPAEQEFIALMGLASTPIDYSGAIYWDREAETIEIDSMSYTWGDLGSMTASVTIANATEALFSYDEAEMLGAALQLGLASFMTEATDTGFIDLVAEVAGYADGLSVRESRTQLAKTASEDLTTDAPELQALWQPVVDFIQTGGRLVVEGRAAGEGAAGLSTFMLMETDPGQFLEAFDISVTNSPVPEEG
ncbi:hypothetical protein [Pelagibacterium sp. H642]|uniref:hypothetical protein n=1 Tax=Pelagibacterium sp. H642 TaxID=1881069 RepID=UPI0028156D2F|nr:hypothetical protein [Pelagibacterium sp. H642]WMT91321.1 hypothetical protein NO934_03405 [Pelagibacterium sp. H642]